MIFNEMMNTNTSASYEAVKESQYELGINGALMHVYENECNYNALMKAVALSEMKYYNENGGNLFVQEAGALSNLATKVKEFFKKIIEKIKAIIKKFVAVINKYTMDDKTFVKKYQTELIRRDLKDFEYNGYNFAETAKKFESNLELEPKFEKADKHDLDSDELNDIKERNRAMFLKSGPKTLTEAEFREELHELLYGDKEYFEVNIREELNNISDAKKEIDKINKMEKEIVRKIESTVKELEREINDLEREIKTDSSNKDDDAVKTKDEKIKLINHNIDIARSYSNDYTVLCGAAVKAITDCKRQAKAICVKALSYKHEAATVGDGSFDLFSGVEIV